MPFGVGDVTWVTTGGVASYVTLLSALVEARLPLPAASPAAPAGIVTCTVPFPLNPDTLMLYVVGPPETTAVPPALPPTITSAELNPVTGSLNTAAKRIGDAFVGSAWARA